MIPKDLTGFSTEQLRGFATATDQRIAELRSEGLDTPEKIADVEAALDTRDRVQTALNAALEAEAGDAAADDAVAGGDGGEGEGGEGDDDAEGEGDGEGDGEGEGDADAEAAANEAVASAQMGGGDGPLRSPHIRTMEPADVRSFLNGMQNGGIRPGTRVNFATMNRKTNFEVRHNGDITSQIEEIVKARQDGTDRTAAGCYCGPDEARTQIAQSLIATRPLSDTLPTVTGGDFRFIRQIDLADALTGTRVWECDDQADVDPSSIGTWKPCFSLDCQTEVVSETYAVPACASFDTQAMIGNPNLIANLEHVMGVAYNLTAELEVYARLIAQASQYDIDNLFLNTGYGAAAKLLGSVGWAMEKIRANHRDVLPYDLVLPAGFRERLITDSIIRGMDDDKLWEDILVRLRQLGVDNVIELVDPTAAVTEFVTPGGPAVPAPPNTLEQTVLLYRRDNFLLGVGPTIDMGVVAASIDELRQNRMNWFVETHESVTRIGVQPTVALTGEFCASGIRPALGEGTVCEVEEG